MSTHKNLKPDSQAEMNAEISDEERYLIDQSMENSLSVDNENLRKSTLDNADDDGDLINEISSLDDVTGEDLDIPGAELDDANEEIGEEDEENNGYSRADTD